MKKIIAAAALLFVVSCCTRRPGATALRKELDSLRLELLSRDSTIDELIDEIHRKEDLADYWGYKHDSLLISIQKKP